MPAVVGLGIAVAGTIVGPPGTIRVDRSFYGVYRVAAPSPDLHILYSGTTIHGREAFTGPYAGEPLSYYHRAGPLGEVITSIQAAHPTLRIGAVGLGAGAIAAYGRAGDSFRFFEIDPTVASIARDRASFTFLADRRPRSMSMSKTGGSVSRRRRPKASTCSCSTPSPRTRFPSTC